MLKFVRIRTNYKYERLAYFQEEICEGTVRTTRLDSSSTTMNCLMSNTLKIVKFSHINYSSYFQDLTSHCELCNCNSKMRIIHNAPHYTVIYFE